MAEFILASGVEEELWAIWKHIAQDNPENDFFQGLVAGKEEYEIEAREWAKSFSKGTPSREKDLDRDR